MSSAISFLFGMILGGTLGAIMMAVLTAEKEP